MPAVSVIIPTYGHRNFVLSTLESVYAQTFDDIEVIVVNDGSPDDTAALLKPLIDAGKIKYVEQPNAGQSAARARGLAMAAGEFVALLDDDDLWPIDKLAWQVDALRRSPDAVAVGGTYALIRDGTLESRPDVTGRTETLGPGDFYGRNVFFSPGQVLVRRPALDAVGGFDAALWGTDDLDLWIRLAAIGPVRFVDRVALHYRLHDANASRHWRRMIANGRRALRKNLHLLPPADRRAALRRGEAFLYFCYGSQRVQHGWSWRPAAWRDRLAAIVAFVRPAVTDPTLAFAIVRDTVPIGLRSRLRPKH